MLKNLTIRTRFNLILGTLTLGFLIFGFLTNAAMKTLSVNGPIYLRIVQGKDLIADILPPPEYILESYLVVLQTARSENPENIEKYKKRFEVLKGEYDTRHKFWVNENSKPETALKAEINTPFLDGSFQNAIDFYTEAQTNFFPAMLEGKRELALASLQKLEASYEKHRTFIDDVVRLTTEENLKIEQNAQSSIQTYKILLISIFIFSVSLSIFIGMLVARNLIKELGGEPNYTSSIIREIAKGNLSVKVDIQPNDKTSLLYAINTMRETLSSIVISVNFVMNEMSNGNFSSRIEGDFTGDFAQLKSRTNASLDELSNTLNDVMRVIEAIAKGDLNQKITTQYKGVFGLTAQSVNETIDELKKIIGEIERVVYLASECGDFSASIQTEEKVGYALLIAKSINQLFKTVEKSLNDVLRVSQSFGDGDLTPTIDDHYPGAFGEVKSGMNTTGKNLKSLVSDIKETIDVVVSAAQEISDGNNNLSSRTEKQAASLQETAAAMEQLSSTVQNNMDSVQHSCKMVLDTEETAKEGVGVIRSVVTTMENINESSRKIVEIITAIDDIAFQTNILALNAAVEASRAGEQGKGFAVVASEVRNLAQRAANAAGEIKSLISNSVESISNGSRQVSQAGKTIEAIADSIHNVTLIMNNIATASVEQNQGIEQIHKAIAEMDEVTHQNAALVVQAAAATESLSEKTRELASEMGRFKIG